MTVIDVKKRHKAEPIFLIGISEKKPKRKQQNEYFNIYLKFRAH